MSAKVSEPFAIVFVRDARDRGGSIARGVRLRVSLNVPLAREPARDI